jgi:hypothetical protein
MSDLAKHVEQATAAIKQIRRLQSEMLALTQKIQTSLVEFNPAPVDWEDRYVHEGFIELEQHANGASDNGHDA